MAMGGRWTMLLQVAAPPPPPPSQDSRPRWVFIPTDEEWDDDSKPHNNLNGLYYVILVVLLLLAMCFVFYYVRQCRKKINNSDPHDQRPGCAKIVRWIVSKFRALFDSTTTSDGHDHVVEPNDDDSQPWRSRWMFLFSCRRWFVVQTEKTTRTTYRYSREGDQPSDCVICLLDLKRGEKVKILIRCGHVFHGKCIDTWLKESWNGSCPVCRESVQPQSS